MDMAILIGFGHQLVYIVDFPHRGDGVASQMGLDQQGLRFVVGNTADAQIALQLLQISVKFRAEGRVLDIMDRAGKALFPVYGHAAPLGSKMGVIVHAKKQIQRTALLRYNSEYSTHL